MWFTIGTAHTGYAKLLLQRRPELRCSLPLTINLIFSILASREPPSKYTNGDINAVKTLSGVTKIRDCAIITWREGGAQCKLTALGRGGNM